MILPARKGPGRKTGAFYRIGRPNGLGHGTCETLPADPEGRIRCICLGTRRARYGQIRLSFDSAGPWGGTTLATMTGSNRPSRPSRPPRFRFLGLPAAALAAGFVLSLACAAAHAVLDVIEEEDLCERANAIGKIILDRCNKLQNRSNLNCVGDVRGLGAMCAIELVKDRKSGEPAPQLTQALMKIANEKGLILLSCGTYGNVIRFLVPLTASDALVRDGMDIFEASLTEAVSRSA